MGNNKRRRWRIITARERELIEMQPELDRLRRQAADHLYAAKCLMACELFLARAVFAVNGASHNDETLTGGMMALHASVRELQRRLAVIAEHDCGLSPYGHPAEAAPSMAGILEGVEAFLAAEESFPENRDDFCE